MVVRSIYLLVYFLVHYIQEYTYTLGIKILMSFISLALLLYSYYYYFNTLNGIDVLADDHHTITTILYSGFTEKRLLG